MFRCSDIGVALLVGIVSGIRNRARLASMRSGFAWGRQFRQFRQGGAPNITATIPASLGVNIFVHFSGLRTGGFFSHAAGSDCLLAEQVCLRVALSKTWLRQFAALPNQFLLPPPAAPSPGLGFCRLGRGSGGRPLLFCCSFPSFSSPPPS